MKILLITSSCPPNSGSHTQRIIPMMRALVANGFELHVLTQDIPNTHPFYDEALLDTIDTRIHIYRSPQGFLHKKAYSSFSVESSQKYQNKTSRATLKGLLFNFVNKYKDVFLYPDAMIDWFYSAIRYERKHKLVESIQPDLIIACSMPEVAQLIGFHFSKKYSIPLYLDTADPWTYLGDYQKRQNTIRFKLDRYLESKLVNHAIGMSFSAPGCTKLYIEKFGMCEEKCITVVTGYEERVINMRNEYKQKEDHNDKIALTYGGALQEYVRDPKPFFSAASNFSCFETVIRTDQLDKVKQWVTENGNSSDIHIKPYIKFEEYFQEMLDADIILFFGNKNDVQLPGKIFNCIATGKHILYIKSNNINNDTVENILSAYGRCFIAKNDISSLRETLSLISEQISVLRTPNNDVDELILQFSEKSQFDKLCRHVKSQFDKYGKC